MMDTEHVTLNLKCSSPTHFVFTTRRGRAFLFISTAHKNIGVCLHNNVIKHRLSIVTDIALQQSDLPLSFSSPAFFSMSLSPPHLFSLRFHQTCAPRRHIPLCLRRICSFIPPFSSSIQIPTTNLSENEEDHNWHAWNLPPKGEKQPTFVGKPHQAGKMRLRIQMSQLFSYNLMLVVERDGVHVQTTCREITHHCWLSVCLVWMEMWWIQIRFWKRSSLTFPAEDGKLSGMDRNVCSITCKTVRSVCLDWIMSAPEVKCKRQFKICNVLNFFFLLKKPPHI